MNKTSYLFGLALVTLSLFTCAEEAPIVSDSDVKPQVVKRVYPEYTRDALENGWSGTVTIRVLVGTDGLVEEVDISESSGYKSLDNAALEAARQWEFTPARKDGNLVRCWLPLSFTFTLV
ncbi:energy transducer TonB [candidate division WOR-3 bacterium]|nr:energy transducer TonB [candidate division WOR-3 bacterium]